MAHVSKEWSQERASEVYFDIIQYFKSYMWCLTWSIGSETTFIWVAEESKKRGHMVHKLFIMCLIIYMMSHVEYMKKKSQDGVCILSSHWLTKEAIRSEQNMGNEWIGYRAGTHLSAKGFRGEEGRFFKTYSRWDFILIILLIIHLNDCHKHADIYWAFMFIYTLFINLIGSNDNSH